MRDSSQLLHFFAVLFCLFMSDIAAADQQQLSSGINQNILLELYTSEGCSSCPPADKFLSGIKQNENLWNTIIPLAFHVDYWNYLGWRDRFSNPVFSERQRDYARQGNARTVYTPGFFVNGQEWRGFFNTRQIPSHRKYPVGELSATIDNNFVTVTFQPLKTMSDDLVLNVAQLDSGLNTMVKHGENRGLTLQHDFVVVSYQTLSMPLSNKNDYQSSVKINHASSTGKPAIALWINTRNDSTPIQATGGWLE